jgi:ribonuclease P protein component
LDKSRAVFAGRRKAGSAVERNRLRRRGKELYRQAKEKIRPGFDIALLVESADPPFEAQLRDLDAALRRLELVRDKWND